MAAAEVFTNQPTTTVTAGGTTAPSPGTVETWTVTSSATFPAASTGTAQFHVADTATGKTGEIIAVTNVSGTTWTVTRGAESSTTVAHAAGFTIVQVVTAGWLNTVSTTSGIQLLTFAYGSTGAAPPSGTYTAGTVAVDQNNIVRVCTVAGSPGTWQRAGQQPYQFYVDDYGAKGDGKIGTGGTCANGTAAFSDSGAAFTSADTGKVILVNQGAANSNTIPFTGSVTYNTATSLTLSANVTSAVASAPYIYGTDDATAINSCVTAAAAFAATSGTAGPNKAQVIFSDKFYCVAGVTQDNAGVHNYNCHIPVPYGPATGAKLMLEFAGTGFSSAQSQYWESTVPQLMGSTIVSCYTPLPQPDATYGQFAIVQVPGGGSGQTGGFFNVLVEWNGITLCAPWRSQACGLDGVSAAQMAVPEGRAMSFTPVNLQAASIGGPTLEPLNISPPSNDVAVGFRFPRGGNNAIAYAGRITTSGWSIGIQANEHFRGDYLLLLYADRAFQIDALGESGSHGYTIGHLTAESCNYVIYVANPGAGPFPFSAQLIDTESIWTEHVHDTANCLSGTAYFVATTSGHLVLNTAANLMCIDPFKFQPGHWTGAPAAPASATAQQNTSYHYATVYCSATTSITNTGVGPASASLTATGQTAGANSAIPVRVKPGWWFDVTYTGTLTTVWDLD